jgi:hypothetical protein
MSGGNRWEEPEENMMSAWVDNDDVADKEQKGGGNNDDDEESFEHSQDSDDDCDYGSIYGESQGKHAHDRGGSGGAAECKVISRQDMFADRAAKAAIMGIESGEKATVTVFS